MQNIYKSHQKKYKDILDSHNSFIVHSKEFDKDYDKKEVGFG